MLDNYTVDSGQGAFVWANLVEVGSMTAIVMISWVKFIVSVVIKYLPCSNAGIYSKIRRAFLEQKLHKRRPFYTKQNGRPDGKHSRLVHSWQVAFKSKPIPALPWCPSTKINASLWSKEMPSSWNLTHCFPLFFLVCSITDYGECPCVGEVTCNLKAGSQYDARAYVLHCIEFV